MSKKSTIKCPHCGQEYLPAEIYYPNAFLGRPTQVFRDENGTILGFNGTDMDTYEEYCCDKCNKKFSIEASVTFKTAEVNDLFDDDEEFIKDLKEENKDK